MSNYKFVDFLDYNEDIIKERLKQPIEYEKFPSLIVPQEFEREKFRLEDGKYASQLRDIIQPIANNIERYDWSPSIFTAMYEASLNAYQHGNKKDPDKLIRISHKVSRDKLEVIIEDQGDGLPAYFIPFLQKVRKSIRKNESFVDWYNYSCNQKKDQNNNGTGTSFMHAYVDDIKYMRSQELGGLAVCMEKEKK